MACGFESHYPYHDYKTKFAFINCELGFIIWQFCYWSTFLNLNTHNQSTSFDSVKMKRILLKRNIYEVFQTCIECHF